MKQIYSLLFVFVFIMLCRGQDPKQNEPKTIPIGQPKLVTDRSIDHYSSLSHNIHCSLMDKVGNLWFGTTGDGVYRFDGKLFFNFTTKHGLKDNCVYSILEDKEGNIWFGTKSGVCHYNGTAITNIPITSTIDKPCSMLQDKSGTIWFGTVNGVYCYNGKSFTNFLENDSVVNKNKLRLKSVERMLEDKNGNMWFCSGMGGGEGVCRYDGKSITNYQPNGDVWVPYMLEDKAGNIWFSGRRNGNFRYDGKTFSDFPEKAGVGLVLEKRAGVGPIIEDKAGNIWFTGKEDNGSGGDGGIWCYDGKIFKNFTPKDGLGDYMVWCMVEDKAGNIWIGTNNTSLYCFDGKTFTCFSEEVSK